jgi:spermidine synthase
MILRPEHRTELVIAFGMGSTYRTALFGGVEVEAVELVPSVPAMFDLFFDDAASHLADAGGRIVIADGRNHVEVSDRRFSAIVVDPPPPVQSAGVSVIASLEFYRASARLLDPGGVMIQWVPVGQTADEMAAHIRTFRSVFRHTLVMLGLSDKGLLLVGSDGPLAIEASAIERVLVAHPAVLADISTAPDSPATTVGEWLATLPAMVWLTDGEVDAVVGTGPLVTDDRPLPEYYLIRHLLSPAEIVHSAARIRELLDP